MSLDSIKYRQEAMRKLREQEERKKQETIKTECERRGIEYPPKAKEKHYDHPDALENSTATILYIIVMLVGAVFNDRLLIWGAASLIYFPFITRHKKKK